MQCWSSVLATACGLAVAVTFGTPALAEPVVYEGTLSYLDAPVDSSADLRFRLFDSAEAGAQIGDTIELPAHTLADGAFKATLDFGASAAGWLEVSVRAPSGDGDYVTLTPRQRIEPGVTNISDEQARAAALAAEEARSNASLSLSRNTSRNPLLDPQGAGFDPNADPGGLGGFGNPDDDYTVGPQGLWVSSGANTYYTGGNVGIGTMTPSMPLEVRTTSAQQAVRGVNSSLGGYGVFGAALGAGGVNFGVFGLSYSPDGSGVFGQANSATGSTFGVTGQADSTSGVGVRGLATATTGTSAVGVYGQSASSGGVGVVGEATSTTGSAQGVFGLTQTDLGNGVIGFAANASGVGAGVYGQSFSTTGQGVHGLNVTGAVGSVAVQGTAAGSGWAGKFDGGQGVESDLAFDAGPLDVTVDNDALFRCNTTAGGTNDPLRLQVDGNTKLWAQTNGGLSIGILTGAPANGLLVSGSLGVGNVPITNKLEVSGNASKTAAGSWLANSDRRIKTEVETVTDALDTLDRVRLVSFEYTDAYKATHESIADHRYLNVIAQEFAQIFPEHVQGSGELLPDGSEILQVDTYPLTIYAAAAVQELRGVVDAQGELIAEQAGDLAEVQSRNETMAAELADLRASIESLQTSRRPSSAALALPLLAATGLGFLAITRIRKDTTR